MLASSVMVAALAEVEEEADAGLRSLASMDLTTSEGVAQATKQQGQSSGLLRAIEVLHECAAEDTVEDIVEEENNG